MTKGRKEDIQEYSTRHAGLYMILSWGEDTFITIYQEKGL